jgi:hypothetical protein
MTPTPDLIAARVATLPLTQAARREALAHVAAGESIAKIFLFLANWLDASPALRPAYQD